MHYKGEKSSICNNCIDITVLNTTKGNTSYDTFGAKTKLLFYQFFCLQKGM